MAWNRTHFLERLSASRHGHATQAGMHELKVQLNADDIDGIKKDLEIAQEAERLEGRWAGEVLADSQRVEAVVALVASRVDDRVRIREARRHTRTGAFTGVVIAALTTVFAVLGWMAKSTIESSVDGRITQIEKSIPSSVNTAVNDEAVRLETRLKRDIVATVNPTISSAVSQGLELDRMFLEATILGVRFDLGRQFANTDRDRMMDLLEIFSNEPAIVMRPSFPSLVTKSVASFTASDNRQQVDRIFELYPDLCLRETEIASALLLEYGRRLAGHPLSASGWDESDVERFQRVTSAMPPAYEPEVLAIQLLVEARGHGATSSRVVEIVKAATKLRARGESRDGREEFVGLLISNSHWIFLSRSEDRSIAQQVEVGQEVIAAHREALCGIADGVREDLVGNLVYKRLVDRMRSGDHTPAEIADAMQTLAGLFPDRADVTRTLVLLTQ